MVLLNDLEVDEKGQGHLDAVHTMIALRAVNPHLSDADEDFIYTVSTLREILQTCAIFIICLKQKLFTTVRVGLLRLKRVAERKWLELRPRALSETVSQK